MFIKKKNYQGIPNVGNSCYLSSLLQLLIRLPIFEYELENYEEYKQRTNHSSNYIEKYIKVFTNIYQILCHYHNTNQFAEPNPIHIIRLLGQINPQFMSPHEQQDTQEVLTLILDFLNHHLKNEFKKQFDDNFKIHILKEILCNHCNYKIQLNDTCLNLSLCAEDKILINTGNKSEILNDYKCDNCKNIGNVEKKQIIIKYPNILMIYYPFYIQTISNDIGCLNQIINMPYTEQNCEEIKYLKYKLTMGVVRIGYFHSIGHYYINILEENENDTKWIRCNDEIVQMTNFDINEYINIRMYIFEKQI